MKLLLCFVLLTGAVVRAQLDYAETDYWGTDYDNFYGSFYNDGGESNEDTVLKQAETSKAEDAELQDVQTKTEPSEPDGKEIDVMEDYQIEDNRSNSGEKEKEENLVAHDLNADETPNNANAEDGLNVDGDNAAEQSNEDNVDTDIDYGIWGDFVDSNDADTPPASSSEDNKDILEETKDILSETSDKFDEQPIEKTTVEIKSSEELGEQSDIDKIIEETTKLLGESDDSFERKGYENSDEIQEQEKVDDIEEDTPEKVYADLNADLDKLFATLDKLSDDSSNESEVADKDETNEDNVQDYEEKFGKPYNEDVALSWRDAEADAAEINENDGNNDENSDKAAEENFVSDEQQDSDDYENIDDSNLSDIFENFVNAKKEQKESNEKNEKSELESVTIDKNNNETVEEKVASNNKHDVESIPFEKSDNSKDVFDDIAYFGKPLDVEPNPDDDLNTMIKKILEEDAKEAKSYGNDALIDEKQPKDHEAVEFELIEANDTKVEENIEQKTVMVDDLSSSELSELMTQFAVAHSEDLDVHSENFAKHVAPIHVTLSVDEPTVITSPNYPDPYPTNNIVDWIFEGPGTGIELNITNFAVNGAIGDYLLVKPGGLDESGTDGLIFSYRLNSERRYRFADVNRMFVRFEAKPGWQFLTGFSFSVKMIWPLPELADDMPVPEPVLQPPRETLTLNLAGVTLPRFNEIKHEFNEMVADMAKAYIRDNDIDQGLNTTLEVTQITRTAVCNIRWPNYETCVEVTFGVPLHYEEESEPRLNAEELNDMWTTYIIKEQFASRLQSLGITEYAIPNDSTVLMVWLVIAAGVLISMAMLAFALWRFSCFEDYTRMQAYGDADSVKNEKRHLDLYPTPHQTLPPLYTENDYKWTDDKYDDSTRVDMGGFANKSYIRDELFDLDSDEDVITTRDRKAVISPRKFYDV